MSREYYQDYGCSFNLRYYPFDTQMCQMIFEMQGKTDNYVRFVKDGEGIEFLGNIQKKFYSYLQSCLKNKIQKSFSNLAATLKHLLSQLDHNSL
jgi:hypothetical protein